ADELSALAHLHLDPVVSETGVPARPSQAKGRCQERKLHSVLSCQTEARLQMRYCPATVATDHFERRGYDIAHAIQGWDMTVLQRECDCVLGEQAGAMDFTERPENECQEAHRCKSVILTEAV